ncbi:N-acetylmuramoyl-L-alanine amidase [Caproiciproducens faecalis]|uniref:N-acetylmuramoyl-L-alanine amidase n=1 Tax=Caproiciproducens faecalis TaxID=2820301 RepID=UPI0021065ECA|nr:N-acetylmuramoyl-L-alanine amidase [Caproiciproducens faecalis]
MLLSYISYNKIDKMALALAQKQNPTIVIDPGHGGEDGGAAGKNSALEKDINLAIALQLEKLLQSSGTRVVMTRTTDISVCDEHLGTIRERKVSDIHNRLKIIEQQGDCIFISIHQNHFTDSRYSGAQIFYSKKTDESKVLAENIKSRVVELIQPENKRETKPATSSIYLLWNTKVTAVLVECGFLSNDSEAAKLNDKVYQQQMAFSIYCGLLDYLHSAE